MNRTDLILGSINCSSESSLCQNLSITTLPQFFVRWDSVIIPVPARPTLFTFEDILSYIDDLLRGRYVRAFTAMPKVFPVVLFSLPPGDMDGKRKVVRVVATSRFLDPRSIFIDFDPRVKARQVVIYTAEDCPIRMAGPFEDANISEFIENHRIALLGTWTFPHIHAIAGLFASVFANSEEDVRKFRDLALETRDIFLWGKAVGLAEQSLWRYRVARSDFPAIVVFEPRKNRFFPFPKVTNFTAAEEWLKKFEGNVDNFTHWSLLLTPTPSPEPVSLVRPTPKSYGPLYETVEGDELEEPPTSGFLKIALVGFLGGGAIMVPIAWFVLHFGTKMYDSRDRRTKKVKTE
jgi:hypothetical protein